MVLIGSIDKSVPKRPTQFMAFYYSYIACPIQNQNFYQLANAFFTMKAPAFGQRYPFIDKTRKEKCPRCPAKMGFNDGEGMDCWYNVRLPLNDEVYDSIYDALGNYIRLNTRDSAVAKDYDSAITEIVMCEKSVLGAIMNGWIIDSPKLKKSVTIATSYNEYVVSVAAIVGYLVRDGVFLTHTNFMADLFAPEQVLKYDYKSQLRAWSLLFRSATFCKVPVKTSIQPIA